jgi:hypothetical protein
VFDRRILMSAEKFWRLSGRTEPFPRSLEVPTAWALPLAVIRLPELHLERANRWLRAQDILLDFRAANRAVKACLIAKSGCGVVFLDGRDAADDQRFSLAHEVAHFLIDYVEPRHAALSRLGPSIKDVIDGLRPASNEERLSGILEGVHTGTFYNLLQRSSKGIVDSYTTLDSEDHADQLALELLAPSSSVVKRAEIAGISWPEAIAFDFCTGILMGEFGLPRKIAVRYSNMLVSSRRQAKSFHEWLGIERPRCRTSHVPSE